MSARSSPPGPELDTTLLLGFSFACRPGCGLCCYATPAASPGEQQRLLQIAPEVRFVGGSGGFRMIPARPDGGACRFLASARCTVHDARPFPCREFPLSVHVGDRWQATVVLGCPGVSCGDMTRWVGPRPPVAPPLGLEQELGSVRREATAGDPTVYAAAARRWGRALRTQGLDPGAAGLAALRQAAASTETFPADRDLGELQLPAASEGLAFLPLFFDTEFGRVAFAATGEGVELLRLREEGGREELLAELPVPSRLPRWRPGARELLEAYQAYVLRRDAFLGAVLEERGDGTLADRLAAELRRVGADVISRAVWRAQLHGGDGGSLGPSEVWDGIRATDADLLDRPTIGAFL